MKLCWTIAFGLLLLARTPRGMLAQAVVEHATVSSGAATVASPAKTIGKSIGSALNNAGKTLSKTHPVSSTRSMPTHAAAVQSRSTPPANVASGQSPAIPVFYEDPKNIKTGMTYKEVLKRFGQPSMMITGEDGGQEMFYSGKGHTAEVLVRDDVVIDTKGTE